MSTLPPIEKVAWDLDAIIAPYLGDPTYGNLRKWEVSGHPSWPDDQMVPYGRDPFFRLLFKSYGNSDSFFTIYYNEKDGFRFNYKSPKYLDMTPPNGEMTAHENYVEGLKLIHVKIEHGIPAIIQLRKGRLLEKGVDVFRDLQKIAKKDGLPLKELFQTSELRYLRGILEAQYGLARGVLDELIAQK